MPTLLTQWGLDLSVVTSGTTQDFTPPVTLPVGTLVVVGWECIAGGTVTSISDTGGNTWTKTQAFVNAATTTTTLFSSILTTALTTSSTITVASTVSMTRRAGAIAAFSDVVSTITHGAFNETSALSVIGGVVTPPANGTVFAVTGFSSPGRTFTPGAGWTAGTKYRSNVASTDRGIQLAWRDGAALASYSTIGAIDTSGVMLTCLGQVTLGGPPPPVGWQSGITKVWTGASWVTKPAKTWTGSAWVTKPVKVYTGLSVNDILREPFNALTAWSSTGVVVLNAGRTGTAINIANGDTSYAIPAPKQSTTYTVGFAYKTTSLAANRVMCQFRGVSNMFTLQVRTDGSLEGLMGATTQRAISAPGLIAINTWYYIEMRVTISNTTGVCEIRRNGVTVAGPFNGDTNAGFTEGDPPTQLVITANPAASVWFDDLYLRNDATFLGDITIP